jgi:hypothetical protein
MPCIERLKRGLPKIWHNYLRYLMSVRDNYLRYLMSVRESKLTESLDRVGFSMSMCVLGEGFSFLYGLVVLAFFGKAWRSPHSNAIESMNDSSANIEEGFLAW